MKQTPDIDLAFETAEFFADMASQAFVEAMDAKDADDVKAYRLAVLRHELFNRRFQKESNVALTDYPTHHQLHSNYDPDFDPEDPIPGPFHDDFYSALEEEF